MLSTHGDQGTTSDSTGGGLYKGIYFPITAGAGSTYLRFTDMNLGGAGSGGLKWMCMYSCFSLVQANWNSMINNGHKPINSNLHLILGGDSFIYGSPNLASVFASDMLTGTFDIDTNGQAHFGPPLGIRDSWYAAGVSVYTKSKFNYGTSAIRFAVAGDAACSEDFLQTTNLTTPSGSPYYNSSQVYP